MNFSFRLKKLRDEKKMNQQEVADNLGIARTTYASYEQGKREPDHETLVKIANFFEVTVDYLLGHQPSGKPVVHEEKAPYKVTDDPDLQIAFKDASDFSEEARRQAIDFIKYLKEKEKAKGRKG
ncbi:MULTISPECIES: helix-turn-helix domain-containing protein [Bacillus]|uniref:helix-turn-helix domain-containing protein n=1 Tax=Bacillus TaxID=1386 RepID=UPI000B42FDDE|nr:MULTISPECIES: helix-turn-helix transcriptional regulator [Bacillus]MDO3660461.1 helix-turn-helix transcriptional regulator [Bacillus sp. C28GYM-DRY-1]MEC1586096.1 helix-turn-helix transcriptional regulator [Bacillus spizizenii]OUL03444.1 transcriptional regulator [Bacillus spizizenii]